MFYLTVFVTISKFVIEPENLLWYIGNCRNMDKLKDNCFYQILAAVMLLILPVPRLLPVRHESTYF